MNNRTAQSADNKHAVEDILRSKGYTQDGDIWTDPNGSHTFQVTLSTTSFRLKSGGPDSEYSFGTRPERLKEFLQKIPENATLKKPSTPAPKPSVEPAATVPAPQVEKVPKGPPARQRILELVRAGHNNNEALEILVKEFPHRDSKSLLSQLKLNRMLESKGGTKKEAQAVTMVSLLSDGRILKATIQPNGDCETERFYDREWKREVRRHGSRDSVWQAFARRKYGQAVIGGPRKPDARITSADCQTEAEADSFLRNLGYQRRTPPGVATHDHPDHGSVSVQSDGSILPVHRRTAGNNPSSK